MATHETSTGGSALRFYRGSGGKLVTWDGEREVKFAAVSGTLTALRVRWDEGNATHKIRAGWKIGVYLEDESGREVVEGKLDSTFGWMLAASVIECAEGDNLLIQAKSGDDPKITFAGVKLHDGDNYVNVQRNEAWRGMSYEERPDALKAAIEAHPAYVAPVTEEAPKAEAEAEPRKGRDPFAKK
jgi:hypothetical protein